MLIHNVPGAAEVNVKVLSGVTLIESVVLTKQQPPVNFRVYLNVPACVGVPLTVMVSFFQLAVTPEGNPEAVVSIPVAPVVL